MKTFPRAKCLTCGRAVCWTAVHDDDGAMILRIDAATEPSTTDPATDVLVLAGPKGPVAYRANAMRLPALPLVARTRLHFATCAQPGKMAIRERIAVK